MSTSSPQSSRSPQAPRTVRTSSRAKQQQSLFGTRNLMIVAALAVAGMLIVIPMSWIAPTAVTSPKILIAACSAMGIWVVPYLLPAVVVRKVGASLLAALLIGIVAAFTTPTGAMSIVGNVLGALFVEVPLIIIHLVRHRWTTASFIIAATCFGVLNGSMYMTIAAALGGGAKTTGFIVAVVSAIVGGVITVFIAKALNKAGVGLDNLQK